MFSTSSGATLKLEDAGLIRIDPAGEIASPLPHGVSAEDLDLAASRRQTTSGRQGHLSTPQRRWTCRRPSGPWRRGT